jgi:YggT family protein
MQFLAIFFDAAYWILSIVSWAILVWVVLSWILFFLRNSQWRWRHRGFYGALETLNDLFERMTRPFLRPIRRFLRRFDTAGIDWSPMVLILIIWILQRVLMAIRLQLYTGPL